MKQQTKNKNQGASRIKPALVKIPQSSSGLFLFGKGEAMSEEITRQTPHIWEAKKWAQALIDLGATEIKIRSFGPWDDEQGDSWNQGQTVMLLQSADDYVLHKDTEDKMFPAAAYESVIEIKANI